MQSVIGFDPPNPHGVPSYLRMTDYRGTTPGSSASSALDTLTVDLLNFRNLGVEEAVDGWEEETKPRHLMTPNSTRWAEIERHKLDVSLAEDRKVEELQAFDDDTEDLSDEDDEDLRLELDRQRMAQEAQRKEEEERLAEVERLRREEDIMRQMQAQRDRKKVEEFLAAKGFKGVNAARLKMVWHKYALHSAVKVNDAELVRLLLEAMADPSRKNSSGQTPLQLARKVDRRGSHADVIRVLEA